jgi:surface protein
MATADKLQKLLETKEQIRQAIIDKGVEVGEDVAFADYSNKIAVIETSGGSDDFLALRTNNHTNYDSLFMNYKGDSLEPFALDTWDTSNVTTMKNMFYGCKAKDYNLGNWDFSKVTDTSSMFSYSDAVNIDLSSWTVNPELTYYNMGQMFIGCDELETLDIRNLNITDCNSNPTITNAFRECDKLHKLRLDNCPNDTINKIITSTGFPTGTIDGVQRKIYVNPDDIGGLTAPDNWIFVDLDGNEIVPGIPVCEYCGEPGCDGSCQDNGEKPYIVATFGTDESVDMLGEPSGYWEASFDNGTTWKDNDDNMTKGNEIVYLKPEDTNNIYIYRLFEDSSYVTHIEFNNFSDYPVYPYADYMFNNCSNLTELDLSSLNFSNGMNTLEGMFNNCRSLESLNLSNFEIGEDCSVDSMLNGCNKLHTLILDNCNEDTISKIIWYGSLPTGLVNGETRKLHCKQVNAEALARPDGWEFVDCETGKVIASEEE